MNKNTFIIAVVILIFFLAAPYSSAHSAESKLDTDELDTYIEQEMSTSRIPGLALGIIKNGEIFYLQGYGSTGEGRKVTAETPFLIGSLSKSFTAVAAMQLVEEGKLELDNPVKKYLPWFTMQGEYDPGKITIRHLIVQTSGIPNMAGIDTMAEGSDLSLKQEVERLSEETLASRPGSTYTYSNANYQILGLVIDEVSETGYSDHVRSKIFEPLEMKESYLSEKSGRESGMAIGHVRWFGFPFATDVQYLDNSLAAGFIISSAKDMSNYLLMQINEGSFKEKEILSEENMTELHKPGSSPARKSGYAMGLMVNSDDDTTIIHHDGANEGFNAAMAFSPEEQWGVVLLTNTSGQIELPAHPMALDIANLLRGEQTTGISRIPMFLYTGLLLVMLAMLFLAVRSILLLPRRWAVKIREEKPKGFLKILTRIILPVGLELLVPFLVFIYIPAGAGFPVWQLYMLFHPELVYGLFALSVLLLGKALWRGYLAFKLFYAAKA